MSQRGDDLLRRRSLILLLRFLSLPCQPQRMTPPSNQRLRRILWAIGTPAWTRGRRRRPRSQTPTGRRYRGNGRRKRSVMNRRRRRWPRLRTDDSSSSTSRSDKDPSRRFTKDSTLRPRWRWRGVNCR